MRSCDLRIFGSGDHLHRFSDLLRVLDACDLTTYLFCAGHELLLNALRPALRQAARRYQDWVALKESWMPFQLAFDFVVVATGLVDLLHQRSVITVDVSQQSGFEAADFRQFNIRQVTTFCCEQNQRLLRNRHRRILFLLQQFGHFLTVVKLLTCCIVKVGCKLRERCQFTILCQSGTDTTGQFFS